MEKESKEWGYRSYKDSLTTVDKSGKRIWVYAKKFKGAWQNRRRIFGYILFLFLVAAPFLKIGGHQMIQLDFVHRKFVLFGSVFWPQDFYIFLLSVLTILVFIVLFTAIFGRVWCGWSCPQTIFMELIFRRVEYFFEGDAPKQRKLSAQLWDAEKIRKRGGKYVAFFLISFILANIFLSYILGSDRVISLMLDGPKAHLSTIIPLVAFTGVFMFIYTYMREQVCTIICPYGRLQSVLLDSRSLVVAYDYVRGEPRGKNARNRDENLGDCIDCKACVQVCPTNIDIRDGLQLECINCTACVDACNDIMVKVNKPTGLIRFDSEEGIEQGKKFKFDTRRVVYSALLFVLASVLVVILATRTDVQATISRMQGSTYLKMPDGSIRNNFNVRLLNKTLDDIENITFQVEDNLGKVIMLGDEIEIKAGNYAEGIMAVEIPAELLDDDTDKFRINVYSNGKKITSTKTRFMKPSKYEM
jgi:cytochrome c oxidase accessory protein FixG